VGIGEVQLDCKTPEGPCVVTLKEMRHVPEAKANLFALRRATDAGARIVLKGAGCRFLMEGVVKMQVLEICPHAQRYSHKLQLNIYQ
jgi:hypothetical protein